MFKVVYTGGKLNQTETTVLQSLISQSSPGLISPDRIYLTTNYRTHWWCIRLREQPSNLPATGGAQVSVYLVVRPDGDFELWQDSLHLQVPLCSINRRLQNVVRFGGRLRFLSENQQHNHQFHSRAEQNSELQTRRRLVSCANKTLLTESYIRCV